MNIKSMFSLSGKTALVTGCNKSIGQAMAIALAEAGADIIGVAASNIESFVQTEQAVKATGKGFKAYQCDFENRSYVYAFIKEVKEQNNRIDILVNNAGIILRTPAAEHTDEFWDKVLAVNLDASFILARELGKEMIAAGSGKIIFTCSLLSYQGGINVPGYAASKGAIASLVKALANEWAGKGVNVNGIVPGYISTGNTAALRNDAERSKSILDRIPAGRWGEPEDIKGAIVFLSSAAADYIHGTLLNVDGGWMGR